MQCAKFYIRCNCKLKLTISLISSYIDPFLCVYHNMSSRKRRKRGLELYQESMIRTQAFLSSQASHLTTKSYQILSHLLSVWSHSLINTSIYFSVFQCSIRSDLEIDYYISITLHSNFIKIMKKIKECNYRRRWCIHRCCFFESFNFIYELKIKRNFKEFDHNFIKKKHALLSVDASFFLNW